MFKRLFLKENLTCFLFVCFFLVSDALFKCVEVGGLSSVDQFL